MTISWLIAVASLTFSLGLLAFTMAFLAMQRRLKHIETLTQIAVDALLAQHGLIVVPGTYRLKSRPRRTRNGHDLGGGGAA